MQSSSFVSVCCLALLGACGDDGGEDKGTGQQGDGDTSEMDASGPDNMMPSGDGDGEGAGDGDVEGDGDGDGKSPVEDAGPMTEEDAGPDDGPDAETPDGGPMPTISCSSDQDCSKRCHPDSKTCVACRFDTDCGANEWCRGDECVAVDFCQEADDCQAPLAATGYAAIAPSVRWTRTALREITASVANVANLIPPARIPRLRGRGQRSATRRASGAWNASPARTAGTA